MRPASLRLGKVETKRMKGGYMFSPDPNEWDNEDWLMEKMMDAGDVRIALEWSQWSDWCEQVAPQEGGERSNAVL